ncbi:MAG: hypothetical protein WC521_06295 [Bdellovibrionales bacterium]
MSGSPSFGIGRFTALVLGLVVFVCMTMIGGASYVKYQLDRAETTLAAPDSALGSEQDLFSQLRRVWGFSGFLGFAQKYVFTHDSSGLPELKERLKATDDIIAHLPESIPAQTKRELTSMAALFDDALRKVDMPAGGELANEFTAIDLAPLYAAMSVLDSRMTSDSAQARLAAQSQAQFWATILTLVSWFSLIIAAACVAGIYMVLRDKQSAPMRALAQSIQNMSRGDMRTAIWGIERQDMIGDLARAVDLARYHFSHLPDVSLLSEEGPVRLRFEGGTRSLFEAMMKSISGDSENIREQSANLTTSVKQHKESIASLSEKVEAILQNIAQRGQNGDRQVMQAVQDMVCSTENLKNAHAHAADQLARLLPIIQDRAQGLSDITQITGKQLTHTLQSLASSEISLKANAETSKETLAKLSSTAGDLGERLFGAINLLQASGKVLGETTEGIKSQWNNMAPAQNWGERLDEIAKQMAKISENLGAQTDAQSGVVKAMQDSQTASAASNASALAPLAGQLEAMMGQLTAMQIKLDTPAPVAEAVTPGDLAAVCGKVSELAEMQGRVAVFVSALPGDMRQALREEIQSAAEQNDAVKVEQQVISTRLAEIGTALAATQRAAEAAQAEAAKPIMPPTCTLPPDTQKQFLDQWFQMSAQIEASRASMIEALTEQIREMEIRIAAAEPAKPAAKTTADYALQVQIEKQTEILAELINSLGLLDAHMQQIKAAIHAA